MTTTIYYGGDEVASFSDSSRTLFTEQTYVQYRNIIVVDETPAPNLQAKSVSYTPSESSQSATIEADQNYDGLESVSVSVGAISSSYVGSGITRRSSSDLTASGNTVSVPAGYYESAASKAVAGGVVNMPSMSVTANPSITIDSSTGLVTSAVSSPTNAIVPSITAGYVGPASFSAGNVAVSGSATSQLTVRTSSDLTASGATVTAPAGYYASAASKAVASGSVTASATKGSVSNHSVQVTPSASVTPGYISSGATGSAVTVQASELVSGNLAITENGSNIDCSTYSTVSVNVSGGGTGLQVEYSSATPSSAASSIQFHDLEGEPTSFWLMADEELSTGSPARVAAVVFDGQSIHGQTITNTSNAQVSADTGFTKSYSNGTLTVTATSAQFQPVEYFLVYTYGGGSIETSDVQVGSGATSISFTGLEDEPVVWSCIFKSNFSTSSGYQRVIATVSGEDVAGLSMDSSAKYSESNYSASYSNGTLTITSSGTNAGGYFHQPGYYQLTYALDTSGNYQSKTVTPTTSQQVVTADSQYDALKKVTVNAIPDTYVQPTATKGATTYTPTTTAQTIATGTYLTGTQTIQGDANLVAGNIKSGTTIFGVTGTYSGGGGGSATVATKSVTASNRPSSLAFSSLSGQPIMFALKATFTMTSSSSTYYYVDSMRGYLSSGSYTVQGRLFQMGSTRQTMNVQTGYSATYSGGTLTLTSTGNRTTSPGCFYNGSYELVYVY